MLYRYQSIDDESSSLIDNNGLPVPRSFYLTQSGQITIIIGR